MTGLVHISGVVDATAMVGTMRDPHRVLVGADDRIGTLSNCGPCAQADTKDQRRSSPSRRQYTQVPT